MVQAPGELDSLCSAIIKSGREGEGRVEWKLEQPEGSVGRLVRPSELYCVSGLMCNTTEVLRWQHMLGCGTLGYWLGTALRDSNFRWRYLVRGGRVGVESSVEHWSAVQAKYTQVSWEKTGSHITVSPLLSCHISLHPHLPHLSPPCQLSYFQWF